MIEENIILSERLIHTLNEIRSKIIRKKEDMLDMRELSAGICTEPEYKYEYVAIFRVIILGANGSYRDEVVYTETIEEMDTIVNDRILNQSNNLMGVFSLLGKIEYTIKYERK